MNHFHLSANDVLDSANHSPCPFSVSPSLRPAHHHLNSSSSSHHLNSSSTPHHLNSGSSPHHLNSGSSLHHLNSGSSPQHFNGGSSPHHLNGSSTPHHLNSGSSPHHSVSPSPNHSPTLDKSAGSKGNSSKAKLADLATGSPTLVYNIFKDSDSSRGVSADYINGVHSFGGRLHSFKDAMHRRTKMTPTNSEPVIHDNGSQSRSNHLSVEEVSTGYCPGEVVTFEISPPVLKSRRRDNPHSYSIYDNASPTELSVLLSGEQQCVSSLEEGRIDAESSFSKDSCASFSRV